MVEHLVIEGLIFLMIVGNLIVLDSLRENAFP